MRSTLPAGLLAIAFLAAAFLSGGYYRIRQHFRTHRNAKSRGGFVRKQLAQLRAAKGRLNALQGQLKAAQSKLAACD